MVSQWIIIGRLCTARYVTRCLISVEFGITRLSWLVRLEEDFKDISFRRKLPSKSEW
jgi:hypothetical protein